MTRVVVDTGVAISAGLQPEGAAAMRKPARFNAASLRDGIGKEKTLTLKKIEYEVHCNY